MSAPEGYLNLNDFIKASGMTEGVIRAMVKRRLIPCIEIGKHKYYHQRQLGQIKTILDVNWNNHKSWERRRDVHGDTY